MGEPSAPMFDVLCHKVGFDEHAETKSAVVDMAQEMRRSCKQDPFASEMPDAPGRTISLPGIWPELHHHGMNGSIELLINLQEVVGWHVPEQSEGRGGVQLGSATP